MTNIFIGLSNNQIKSYESLLEKGIKGNNILIANSSLNFDQTLFSKVILSESSFNNQASGRLQSIQNITNKISEYKRIVKALKLYKRDKDITLYFTYIEDVLTNYLFFSFNKNLRGIVVEDGTLNYYNHTIENLDKKKVYLKKVLSSLYGLNFTLYKGHSSGIEYNKVIKQYVRSPKLSMFPEKSEELPYSKRSANLTDTFLIIGQEAYINESGKELYNTRLQQLFEVIKKNDGYNTVSKIYYKPHRNGERIDYNLLYDAFLDKEVEVLSANEPLEDLYFNEIGSENIFSFDSSALLNIYLEAAEEIKSKIKFTVLLKYNKELRFIFERFNFKIIE